MEKTINVSKIKFNPIEISINIKITSLDELNDFIKFENNGSEICDYDGNNCNTLTTLVEDICTAVVEQL